MNSDPNFLENRSEDQDQNEEPTKQRNWAKYVFAAVVVAAISLLAAQAEGWWPFAAAEEVAVEQQCSDQIVTALNPETGGIRDFPSDCDVPADWTILTDEDFAGLGLGPLSETGGFEENLEALRRRIAEAAEREDLSDAEVAALEQQIGAEQGLSFEERLALQYLFSGGGAVAGESTAPRTGAGVWLAVALAAATTVGYGYFEFIRGIRIRRNIRETR